MMRRFTAYMLVIFLGFSVSTYSQDTTSAMSQDSLSIIQSINKANAEKAYNKGLQFYKAKNKDSAIYYLSIAVALDTAFTKAFYNRGNIFLRSKH